MVCWYVQGIESFQGFLGGAGICPSTVGVPLGKIAGPGRLLNNQVNQGHLFPLIPQVICLWVYLWILHLGVFADQGINYVPR